MLQQPDSTPSFGGCGELMGFSLDVYAGSAIFAEGRFSKFFGGAHAALSFFRRKTAAS